MEFPLSSFVENSEPLTRLQRKSFVGFAKDVCETSVWLQVFPAFSALPISILSLFRICRFAWKITHAFDLRKISDDLFLISPSFERDLRKVLFLPMYNFFGFMLAVKKWPDPTTLQIPNMQFVEVWIQVHYIPERLQTTGLATRIAWFFKSLVEIDEGFVDYSTGKEVMRMKMVVDTLKPIPLGFTSTISSQYTAFSRILYENLGIFCKKCGCCDHAEVQCNRSGNSGPGRRLHPFACTPRHILGDEVYSLSMLEHDEIISTTIFSSESAQSAAVAKMLHAYPYDFSKIDMMECPAGCWWGNTPDGKCISLSDTLRHNATFLSNTEGVWENLEEKHWARGLGVQLQNFLKNRVVQQLAHFRAQEERIASSSHSQVSFPVCMLPGTLPQIPLDLNGGQCKKDEFYHYFPK